MEVGEMIIMKEVVDYWIMIKIGANIKDNLDADRKKDSDRYGSKTELNTKVNFEMIYHGVKGVYLAKMERSKTEYGKKVVLFQSSDLIFLMKISLKYWLLWL